jgi:hypothetical protein
MGTAVKCQKPDLPRVKVVAALVTVVSDCAGVNSGDSILKFHGLDTVTKSTMVRISMLQSRSLWNKSLHCDTLAGFGNKNKCVCVS